MIEERHLAILKTLRNNHFNFMPWIKMDEKEIADQREYQQLLTTVGIATFGQHSFVSPMAVLHGKISVGSLTFIAANAVVRGYISIGSNSTINVFSHLAGKITIGDGVRIANNVSIFAFNHGIDDIDTPIHNQGITEKGIIIEDNVWIGANASIADGVRIGTGSVIGMGAVVTKSVPPFSVMGGNPAKVLYNRVDKKNSQKRSNKNRAARTYVARPCIFQQNDPYDGFTEYRPLDLQGWGSLDPMFADLLTQLRPRLIAEIGTWKGASAIHQAEISRKLGFDCEIVCVDTWLGNWQHRARPTGEGSISDLCLKSGYPMLYYQFLSNVILSGVDDIITPLPLPSLSAVKLFEHYKLRPNLVYIDADHEYESVSQDLPVWFERLAPGGILCGDDFTWPGVERAVKEFSDRTGLRYIQRGAGKYVFDPRPEV